MCGVAVGVLRGIAPLNGARHVVISCQRWSWEPQTHQHVIISKFVKLNMLHRHCIKEITVVFNTKI